jgi:hypothetical protein
MTTTQTPATPASGSSIQDDAPLGNLLAATLARAARILEATREIDRLLAGKA